MTTELMLNNTSAYCHEVKQLNFRAPIAPALRVFRNVPDAIQLQVRCYGGIGNHGQGVKRNMIAGVNITAAQAEQVIEALTEFVKQQRGAQ